MKKLKRELGEIGKIALVFLIVFVLFKGLGWLLTLLSN